MAAAPAPLHLPAEELAPLYLPDERQAPEFLPSEVFDELLTEIFKRPEDADTEREYLQELPPLPRPKPAAAPLRARPRATPAEPQPPLFRGGPGLSEAPLLEPRGRGRAPAALQRSPRSSADSIATVRPISMPPLDRRQVARASRRLEQQRPAPVEEALRQQPIPRSSAQRQAVPRSSAQRPAAALPIRAPGYDAVFPRLDQTGAPLEARRQPLEHQDEPLAFGGEVLRRAATAVEPAIGLSIRAPRPILWAGSAAALVAAAIVLLAAFKIAESRRVRAKEMAVSDAAPVDRSGEPRLARVALSAEEPSRVRHRKSAEFRDRWKANVWFHPLTGELRLPENPTRKFGAKRSGERPIECGRGHCGVDMGDFGLDVHAVRDGVIEKIQWQPKNHAGKYVRIEHDDGFTSYYIHLHRIRKDLKEGMRVEGGEQIGITGKTGIRKSRPHLHFALSYKDGREKVFIDPEPLLRRSIWSLDDSIAAETADASVVAAAPAALDDDVEPRRKHKVHKRRDKHSSKHDRSE